jgi:hypothetical protein
LALSGPAAAAATSQAASSRAAATASTTTAAAAPAKAPAPCCPQSSCPAGCAPREQDQLWLVDSRAVGCGDAAALVKNLKYSRLDAQAGWVASTREQFQASDDPNAVTSVFVHGNQIDAGAARDWVGPAVYRSLVRQAPSPRPLRFVIWSWPSERTDARALEDVRIKAYRTDREGYFLARVLGELDPRVQTSLVGYSYGARILDSALHLLGGGKLAGYSLSNRVHPERIAFRTVDIAAAEDNDWLLPGHRLGKALSQDEKLLNIFNSCDLALNHYHLLYGRRCCQEALGCTGLAGIHALGPDRGKVAQCDACCIVGREHNWELYFGSPALVARMAPYVFCEDQDP